MTTDSRKHWFDGAEFVKESISCRQKPLCGWILCWNGVDMYLLVYSDRCGIELVPPFCSLQVVSAVTSPALQRSRASQSPTRMAKGPFIQCRKPRGVYLSHIVGISRAGKNVPGLPVSFGA